MSSRSSPLDPISSVPLSSEPPLSADVATNVHHNCSKCKRQLPANLVWKTCESCREKARYRSRKKDAAVRAALATVDISTNYVVPKNGKRKHREKEDEDLASRLGGMKEKMRKHFKRNPVCLSECASTSLTHKLHDSNCLEYQTATKMYKALKKCRASSKVNFSGCFSIVAVPGIDHEARKRLVIRELRKIAKWSFDHNTPVSSGSATRPHKDSSVAVLDLALATYNCTCQQPPPVPAIQATAGAASAPAPLQRKPSDLTAWVRKASNPGPIACKGYVYIVIEEDNSHPLSVKGIKGQNIHVSIKHIS